MRNTLELQVLGTQHDTLAWATGMRVGASDHIIALFCIEYGYVLVLYSDCCATLHKHNPTPTAAVVDPSQGNQKRTNYKDKQSICTAGTFRLTCTHAMANQALLCQPYPSKNQIKSLRPHHDINPKGNPLGTTRTHKYLNV